MDYEDSQIPIDGETAYIEFPNPKKIETLLSGLYANARFTQEITDVVKDIVTEPQTAEGFVTALVVELGNNGGEATDSWIPPGVAYRNIPKIIKLLLDEPEKSTALDFWGIFQEKRIIEPPAKQPRRQSSLTPKERRKKWEREGVRKPSRNRKPKQGAGSSWDASAKAKELERQDPQYRNDE